MIGRLGATCAEKRVATRPHCDSWTESDRARDAYQRDRIDRKRRGEVYATGAAPFFSFYDDPLPRHSISRLIFAAFKRLKNSIGDK